MGVAGGLDSYWYNCDLLAKMRTVFRGPCVPFRSASDVAKMKHSDEHFQDLLRRMREGSEEAAWELVDQYADPLRRAVRRRWTRDCGPSSTRWTLFRSLEVLLPSPRPDRPIQEPGELGAYLATIARNKVGMESRRRLLTQKYNVNRERPLDAENARGAPDIDDPGPAPIEVAIARERWDGLLRSQPAHYRRIIELKLQGHTCREIAHSLHLAECTVRRFLNRLLEEAAV